MPVKIDEYRKAMDDAYARIDSSLKKDQNTITLKDIADIYWEHDDLLYKFRATASNMTGYSEFLIFRLIYNMLEKDYGKISLLDKKDWPEKYSPPTPTVKWFGNDKVLLSQNASIIYKSIKKYQPDIQIRRRTDGDILGIIQIKAYFNDKNIIYNEIDKIKLFWKAFPKRKVMLLNLCTWKPKNDCLAKFQKDCSHLFLYYDIFNNDVASKVIRKHFKDIFI